MLLGCVADDLTGATDLALMLTREGMRTLLSAGLPPPDLDVGEVDAVVVALKSRTIAAPEAVRQSRASAQALAGLGARRLTLLSRRGAPRMRRSASLRRDGGS